MDFSILTVSPLFAGIEKDNLAPLLSCLGAKKQSYPKESILFSPGSRVGEIGVLLRGQIRISREDAWGNRALVASLAPGELFLETFACSGAPLSVFVAAPKEAEVLFLDIQKILSVCPSACPFHARLVQNLLSVFAGKNLLLSSRLELLSRRSTREKLLCFLSQQARRQGGRSFFLPLTRQELADTLCVDRSAMTVELFRLQQDGLVRFSGRNFTLLTEEE